MSEPDFSINSPKVLQETIDGEVVIINLDTGHYFSLLKTGAKIWRDIEQGITQIDIVNRLHHQYEGDRTAIEQVVHQFLAELQQEELIVSTSSSQSQAATQHLPPSAATAALEMLTFEPPTLEKFTDMEDLLSIDPIHEVDGRGWPHAKPKAS